MASIFALDRRPAREQTLCLSVLECATVLTFIVGLYHVRLCMEKRPSVEILSPYPHELNGPGTDCASDCPACRWTAEQESQSTLMILSAPDFSQRLKLAIDRAVSRVIAQPYDVIAADEKEENHASLVAHSQ